MDQSTHIYTVSELTRSIKSVIEGSFPAVWVEGEISNFVFHTSGHMYFSLKDDSSVLAAVYFRHLNQSAKFELKNGIKVICFGRISLYDKRGQYQLYIERVEPKGIGALGLALEQLKEKLAKEGLFAPEKKKSLPFLPKKVGVVSSPTGAAVRDMINVLTRRYPNIEIILAPVKVQGPGAREEIADAVKLFNELNNVDVIIVGRGGGSLEDLWAFNEEIVARSIAGSKIPVVSAVGHEIDWTIADLVADMRAPTPSAAAELIVPVKDELENAIDHSVERLKNALKNLSYQHSQRIDDMVGQLGVSAGHLAQIKKERFLSLISKLEALSPLGVLQRGYSITTGALRGNVICDAKTVKIGEKIRTRLFSGSVISRVEDIERPKPR